MLEEAAVMSVLKAESGTTINVFSNPKLIPPFVSLALQPISLIQEANVKKRKKGVSSINKMSAHHVTQIMSTYPIRENVSEDYLAVYTTERANVFHVKPNTFTIKAKKNVS